MIGFEDFVSPAGAGDGNAAALLLPTGTAASGARRALEGVFGSDDDLAVCRLVIGGEDVGVVRRDALLDLTNTTQKRGLGEGDGGKLPGTALYDNVIKLTCPVPACPASPTWMVAYDEDDPPRCGMHPDTALRDAR